jgi:hypothetical protein
MSVMFLFANTQQANGVCTCLSFGGIPENRALIGQENHVMLSVIHSRDK